MLFLRYESLKEYIRLYPVTTLLLLVNIAVYIAMLIVGDPRASHPVFMGPIIRDEARQAVLGWRASHARHLSTR